MNLDSVAETNFHFNTLKHHMPGWVQGERPNTLHNTTPYTTHTTKRKDLHMLFVGLFENNLLFYFVAQSTTILPVHWPLGMCDLALTRGYVHLNYMLTFFSSMVCPVDLKLHTGTEHCHRQRLTKHSVSFAHFLWPLWGLIKLFV